jgi:hypothetical protein
MIGAIVADEANFTRANLPVNPVLAISTISISSYI